MRRHARRRHALQRRLRPRFAAQVPRASASTSLSAFRWPCVLLDLPRAMNGGAAAAAGLRISRISTPRCARRHGDPPRRHPADSHRARALFYTLAESASSGRARPASAGPR
jgi:hypothetical protein